MRPADVNQKWRPLRAMAPAVRWTTAWHILICPAAAAFVGFLSFVITRLSTKGRVNA
jgi:hypothetical protein